jgi:hypothetical protein
MTVSQELTFELHDIPMDVFELDNSGLTVQSLTAGHGMTDFGASCGCMTSCCTAVAAPPFEDDQDAGLA